MGAITEIAFSFDAAELSPLCNPMVLGSVRNKNAAVRKGGERELKVGEVGGGRIPGIFQWRQLEGPRFLAQHFSGNGHRRGGGRRQIGRWGWEKGRGKGTTRMLVEHGMRQGNSGIICEAR
jgi:hypothetical protein